MYEMYDKLTIFVERLKKINIKIELVTNYPWVYINKINGKRVVEHFQADHGFTIAFLPLRADKELRFTEISEIFKLIRKYTKYGKNKRLVRR